MSVKEYSPHSISATFSKSVKDSRFEQDARQIPIKDTVKTDFNTFITFTIFSDSNIRFSASPHKLSASFHIHIAI